MGLGKKQTIYDSYHVRYPNDKGWLVFIPISRCISLSYFYIFNVRMFHHAYTDFSKATQFYFFAVTLSQPTIKSINVLV